MWDLAGSDYKHKRIEIFQLWVNLPTASKDKAPCVSLLQGSDIPTLPLADNKEVKVICGAAKASSDGLTYTGPGTAVAESSMAILHLKCASIEDGLDRPVRIDLSEYSPSVSGFFPSHLTPSNNN